MLTKNIDDQSNQTEVNIDQSVGTQGSSEPTEQATGQASDSFMNVDQESMTDAEKERFNNMNSVFTQRMQSLADTRRELDAKRSHTDLGELVAQNPEINKLVYEAVGRIQAGQPIESPFGNNQQSAQSQVAQDMTPEEIEARKLIAEVTTDVLQKMMPTFMQPVHQVTQYMQQNQVQSEYSVLCNKYPNAKSVSLMALQNKQLQYRRNDGSMIKLEEAYDLMAGSNPALHTTQPGQPPQQKLAGGVLPKSKPGVEQGYYGGGAITTPAPVGTLLSKIRDVAKRNAKEGAGGLNNATRRAMERFAKEHPQSQP